LTSLVTKYLPEHNALRKLFKVTFYATLYTICALFAPGCVTPQNAIAEDETHYSTWEFAYSGKYHLVWYYNTKEDLRNNIPNRALVRDKVFLLRPEVRPPTINGVYLLELSKVNEGEEVLDIGTGSGIHAIFAAETAKRVVATDIYAPAIENAITNARLHGVEEKIDFRVGDLFEPVKEGEKFDVFFVNINFPFSINDDDRNRLHQRLFTQIRKYMKPNARIYFQTSFAKNIPTIYAMLTQHNFRIMELRMDNMVKYNHEPIFMMIQTNFNQPP
jgi:SAM-dependent methyltransferase